jgi:predicted NACHT family NTPase
VLEVLSFTQEHVTEFIQNWYLATKLIAYGKDNRKVRQEAQQEGQKLLGRLGQKHHLQDLTVNPLLLTMIANVHNYRGVLPEKRINLYAEICDVFLEKWQQAKGINTPLDARQKRAVLQPLADAMMIQKVNEISLAEAHTIIKSPLTQVVGASDSIPSAFLETVQASSGLIIEKEPGL